MSESYGTLEDAAHDAIAGREHGFHHFRFDPDLRPAIKQLIKLECVEARLGEEEDFEHQQKKLIEGERIWRNNMGENHVQVQNGRPVTGSLRRKRYMGSSCDHRIPTGTETDAAIVGCRIALVKETVEVASGVATRAAANQHPKNVSRGRAAMRRWMWFVDC